MLKPARKKIRFTFILFCLPAILLFFQPAGFTQSLTRDRNEGRKTYQRLQNRLTGALRKESAKIDRGVGIMDRGELANVVGNFGVLSNFHLFSPAMHWPSWADDTHQYSFGLALLVGVKGDVVTSIHDPATVAENFDWEARDGSLGGLFSGEVTASDGTPILASSDVVDTWPRDNQGNPFWPGFFRKDPETGETIPGEFVSERDIYAEFTDANNQNGPYGLKVLQTTYSFGRLYAQDFLIFDFRITNTSAQNLDSIYVGYQADFKVDFDTHDKIRFGQPGTEPDLVYLYDGDPGAGIWDITGYIGFLSLFTPHNLGITDFHYYDNIYEPSTNEQLWEIMSSDTSGTHITPSLYFHGDNYRIDDASLSDNMDPGGLQRGTDFVFMVSSGPITLAAGDTVHSAFAIVMGESEDELFANAAQVRRMAANNYLGYSPPRAPRLYGTTRKGKVYLNWEAGVSENSVDLLSGEKDFEGFRLYRSEDFGKTWGRVITDEKGFFLDYYPLAQFDRIDDITGKDPLSHYYLGDDTGLQYRYVDDEVIPGKEYWYALTAYDQGNPSPDSGYASLESPRGATPEDQNVVSVIPAQTVDNFNLTSFDSLTALGGRSDSRVQVSIVNTDQLTGDSYRVLFDDAADTTTYTLINLSSGDTLVHNFPIPPDQEVTNTPITEGFRLTFLDRRGVTGLGWTNVQGDTPTYEWRVTNFEAAASNPQVGPEAVYTTDDYRLTVDYNSGGGSQVGWYDIFANAARDTAVHIPLKIEVITDPDNPVDIGSTSWLREYDLFGLFPNREAFFSPLGWDLEPGGAGFNPNFSPGGYLWVDIINPEQPVLNNDGDTLKINGLYLLTQNYPEAYINQYGDSVYRPPVKPAQGDQFTIRTRKALRSEVSYEFSTDLQQQIRPAINIPQVKVVPNPYIVKAGWENSQFSGRLQFANLPPRCKIDIYTIAGDHVISLHHNDIYDYTFWNLQNKSGVSVAYGLYVYVVTTPDDEKQTGRFAIIR
ncbi:MAG: hypothetical protein WAN36_12140 [Calditrichia bacterium]